MAFSSESHQHLTKTIQVNINSEQVKYGMSGWLQRLVLLPKVNVAVWALHEGKESDQAFVDLRDYRLQTLLINQPILSYCSYIGITEDFANK